MYRVLCHWYSDGSAKGGPGLDSGVDYEEVHGVLQFQHCEAKKQVILKMNKDSLVSISTVLFPALFCYSYSAFLCKLFNMFIFNPVYSVRLAHYFIQFSPCDCPV